MEETVGVINSEIIAVFFRLLFLVFLLLYPLNILKVKFSLG